MASTPFRSAKELAAEIRRKKIGCLELLDLYLARVEKHNPRSTPSSPPTSRARASARGPPTGRCAQGRCGGRSTACP